MVDADGIVLGLVVDRVHEVLNVPKRLVEPPPPITSNGGMELSGVAKLNDGSRLIMLLDVAHLTKDEKLRTVQHVHNSRQHAAAERTTVDAQTAGHQLERSAVGHLHAW